MSAARPRDAAIVERGRRLGATLDAWRAEAGVSRAALARALGMDPRTLSARLAGRYPFTVDDLSHALDTLGRPLDDFPQLFPGSPVDGVHAADAMP